MQNQGEIQCEIQWGGGGGGADGAESAVEVVVVVLTGVRPVVIAAAAGSARGRGDAGISNAIGVIHTGGSGAAGR